MGSADDSDPRTVPTSPRWNRPTEAPGDDAGEPVPRSSPPERYEVGAELGRGGMGRVVEAYDRALGRAVAIKHSLTSDGSAIARFEREARITAKLQHPGIVPILDVGRDDKGLPFYIMRKIDGEPLQKRVAGADGVRERLALVAPLLGAIDAVAYAHDRRVVHRDIKPDNILLGPFGETLLIDWGLARELGESEDGIVPSSPPQQPALTRAGAAFGTPGFLSPEQARGEPVDPRSDVYSLGATLYFVLAGRVPHHGTGPTRAITLAAEGVAPDLAQLPREVPPELVAITAKALAAEPADRYAHAGELASDLRRFLAGQLVAAHAYTPRERIRRFLARHKIATAVTVVAIAAIVATVLFAFRSIAVDRDRAVQAGRLAEQRADEALVDRARSLIGVDPTSAVAVLRGLRHDSPLWDTGRAIVRAAASGGIERRIAKHERHVAALAFSPDGRYLASSADRLVVHDLATGAARVLDVAAPARVLWRDDATLAFMTIQSGERGRAGTIDVATGALTELPIANAVDLVAAGGRVLVRGADGMLLANDARGSAPHVTGVRTVAAHGAHLAYTTDDVIAIERAGADRTTIPLEAPVFGRLVLSEDGTRVALMKAGVIREWDVRSKTPRQWQRPGDGFTDLGYAGNALYAWSNDGGGVVRLENAGLRPQWTVRERRPGILIDHFAAYRGGTVIATDGGGLAFADARGLTPLAHRPLAVTRVAVDAEGQRVALGTSAGEVLVLDLGRVRPETLPLRATLLWGAMPGVLVLSDPVVTDTSVVALAGTEGTGGRFEGVGLLHLDERRLVRLPGRFRYVASSEDMVVASETIDRARMMVWDRDGNVLGVLAYPSKIAFAPGVMYFVHRDGRVGRFRAADRSTEWLGKLPDDMQVVPPLRSGSLLDDLYCFDGDLFITVYAPDGHRFLRLEADQTWTPIALDIGAWPTPIGRTSDGTWWAVDMRNSTLWRLPAVGAPSIASKLTGAATRATVRRDRVWAFGESKLTELAEDGRALREMTLPTNQIAATLHDRVFLGETDGVVELTPSANVRRVLVTPGRVRGVAATPEGKRIAALLTGDDTSVVAFWRDTVPGTTAETPAFVDALTNARLAPGSEALTWDP